jgi:H+/Cl- antiporter ClcA
MHPSRNLPPPLRFALRWLLPSVGVALAAGLSSGFFLWALAAVTAVRLSHPNLVWFLPLAGLVSGLAYHFLGGRAEAGNNLLLQAVRQGDEPIPRRMAPLVLGGTLLAHLFGASVGREGTALQMAGSLSDPLARLFRLDAAERRVLLRASIAGGFAAVFGTPLAGCLFALEVVTAGSFDLLALLPCLLSALLADQVVARLPVHHAHYAVASVPVGIVPFALVALFGVLCGLVARAFAASTRRIGAFLRARVPWPPLRPAVGGVLVVLLMLAFGPHWLGLGLPGIAASFDAPSSLADMPGKFLFTVVSLGSGIKGGEVTPLFYIGSTLGSALSPWLGLPACALAAVGFVAVFAGATNTPLACTVMAMELFGSPVGPLAAVGCLFAWLASGHAGIYAAQTHAFRKGAVKSGTDDLL